MLSSLVPAVSCCTHPHQPCLLYHHVSTSYLYHTKCCVNGVFCLIAALPFLHQGCWLCFPRVSGSNSSRDAHSAGQYYLFLSLCTSDKTVPLYSASFKRVVSCHHPRALGSQRCYIHSFIMVLNAFRSIQPTAAADPPPCINSSWSLDSQVNSSNTVNQVRCTTISLLLIVFVDTNKLIAQTLSG